MTTKVRYHFRPIQFTIRFLLLVMLVLAAFLAGKGAGQHFGDLRYQHALEIEKKASALKAEVGPLKAKADLFDEMLRKQNELDRIRDQLERNELSKHFPP